MIFISSQGREGSRGALRNAELGERLLPSKNKSKKGVIPTKRYNVRYIADIIIEDVFNRYDFVHYEFVSDSDLGRLRGKVQSIYNRVRCLFPDRVIKVCYYKINKIFFDKEIKNYE